MTYSSSHFDSEKNFQCEKNIVSDWLKTTQEPLKINQILVCKSLSHGMDVLHKEIFNEIISILENFDFFQELDIFISIKITW